VKQASLAGACSEKVEQHTVCHMAGSKLPVAAGKNPCGFPGSQQGKAKSGIFPRNIPRNGFWGYFASATNAWDFFPAL